MAHHQNDLANVTQRKLSALVQHNTGPFCRLCDLIEALRGIRCKRIPGEHHHLTLADLAAAPARIHDLCRCGRAALAMEIASLQGALAAAMSEDSEAPPEPRDLSNEVLLDAKQMAERLSVPQTWVRDSERAGRIPSVRVGRYVRFRASEVARALTAGARQVIRSST